MAESQMSAVLDILGPLYGEGVYPGRSDGMGAPTWREEPFQILIATLLSQRTRDENTRRAADSLFSSYPDLQSMAGVEAEELEPLIRPAGFPRQKAKAIAGICQALLERFDGKVPADMDSLLSLPMVGRKTANCVLAYAFDEDAICVDTHVHRISNLLGEVETKTPDETEMALRERVPRERWKEINRYLVRHGQKICIPRRERCGDCPVQSLCRHGSSLVVAKE